MYFSYVLHVGPWGLGSRDMQVMSCHVMSCHVMSCSGEGKGKGKGKGMVGSKGSGQLFLTFLQRFN